MNVLRAWTGGLLRSTENDSLCARCSAIGLRSAMKARSQTIKQSVVASDDEENGKKKKLSNSLYRLHRIADLGTIDTWSPQTCVLCSMLHTVHLGSIPLHFLFQDPGTEYFLGVFPLRVLVSQDGQATFEHLTGNINLALAVVPWVLQDLATKGTLPVIAYSLGLLDFMGRVGTHACRLSPTFDVAQVKKWIAFCDRRHFSCKDDQSDPGFQPSQLINCYSGKLVKPDTPAKYVALSYVWGKSTSTESGRQWQPSDPWPRVVGDAIEVTKSLGFVHLWVDKYCIDQNDPVQRAREIKFMHQIYSNAKLTLVAACGDNAECGLLGAINSGRPPATQLVVDGMPMHIVPPDPVAIANTSVWSTRGWTYQEKILSTRRLYFTPREVFFECRKLRYREAIDEPEAYLADSTSLGRDLDSNGHINEISMWREPPASWFHYLEQYSHRRLTFKTDALRAFQGILSHYETRDEPWYHIWGLLLGGTEDSHDFYDGLVSVTDCSPLKYLARSLVWLHKPPERSQAIQRISSFPSWSWLGWTGAKTMKWCRFSPKGEDDNEIVEATISTIDGVSYKLDTIAAARLASLNNTALTKILSISAPLLSILSIKIKPIGSMSKPQYDIKLDANRHQLPETLEADLNCPDIVNSSSALKGIILGAGYHFDRVDRDSGIGLQLRMLIVRLTEADLWERIDAAVVYTNIGENGLKQQWETEEIHIC